MKGSTGAKEGKEHIKLDLLKGNFDTKLFIDIISSNLLANNTSSNDKEFNAKPFVRQFESAVDELLKIRRRVQNKMDDMQDEIDSTESSRNETMKSINVSFTEIQEHYSSLELSLQNVGNAAIKVGKQLEVLDNQKLKVVETKALIQLFQDFRAGDPERLREISETWPYDEMKTIIMARRLASLAREVDLTDIQNAKTNIEAFCEDLERTLIMEFDSAYKKADIQEMKRIASLLYNFNGGNSCVQMYISSSPFFTKKQYPPSFKTPGLVEDPSSNPTPNRFQPAPKELSNMMTDILVACSDEWKMIQTVFPNPKHVMQQYMQRTFAQVIQHYLETTVPEVDTNPLMYLRYLQVTHQTIRMLVQNLTEFDENIIQPTTNEKVLSDTVQRGLTDLYVMHLDSDKAYQVELSSLNKQVYQALNPFWIKLNNRNRALNKKGNRSIVQVSPAFVPPPPPTQGKEVISAYSYEEFKISIDTVLNLIGWNIEALSRAKEFIPISNLAEKTEGIWKVLINSVATYYVESSLLIAVDDFPAYDVKNEPEMTPLSYLKVAHQALKLFQVHFNKSVVPLIIKSPNLHRNLVQEKNDWIGFMEAKMNHLLKKQLEVISQWISSILSKQKKTEYKPKEEGNSDLPSTSVEFHFTCDQICTFLLRIYNTVVQNFEGLNKESILTEIAMEFHGLFLDHLKKLQISQTGGLLLSRDLLNYQETMSQFHLASIQPHFDMLRELGNLYVVKADVLKNMVNQGYLSKMDASRLLPYVSMREDWTRLNRHEKEIFGKRTLDENENVKQIS